MGASLPAAAVCVMETRLAGQLKKKTHVQVVDPTDQETATIGTEGASGADDWTATATKRDHLSANAQKLFDLAMQVQMSARRVMDLFLSLLSAS